MIAAQDGAALIAPSIRSQRPFGRRDQNARSTCARPFLPPPLNSHVGAHGTSRATSATRTRDRAPSKRHHHSTIAEGRPDTRRPKVRNAAKPILPAHAQTSGTDRKLRQHPGPDRPASAPAEVVLSHGIVRANLAPPQHLASPLRLDPRPRPPDRGPPKTARPIDAAAPRTTAVTAQGLDPARARPRSTRGVAELTPDDPTRSHTGSAHRRNRHRGTLRTGSTGPTSSPSAPAWNRSMKT